MEKHKCEECIHFIPECADDIACCNCCENGNFFEKYELIKKIGIDKSQDL